MLNATCVGMSFDKTTNVNIRERYGRKYSSRKDIQANPWAFAKHDTVTTEWLQCIYETQYMLYSLRRRS